MADEPKDRGKHAQHIRAAETLEDKLRAEGQAFEANVIRDLRMSSIHSRAMNRRVSKEYRQLWLEYQELKCTIYGYKP